MRPLLVLRKTSVLPWYGHTKRCMGVLILVVDQGVDPPMGVFPNNNVIHRNEIQILYNLLYVRRDFVPFCVGKVRLKFFSRMHQAFRLTIFPHHKMFKSILILCPALEAHHIVFITCQQYISVIMSYCIVRPDV